MIFITVYLRLKMYMIYIQKCVLGVFIIFTIRVTNALILKDKNSSNIVKIISWEKGGFQLEDTILKRQTTANIDFLSILENKTKTFSKNATRMIHEKRLFLDNSTLGPSNECSDHKNILVTSIFNQIGYYGGGIGNVFWEGIQNLFVCIFILLVLFGIVLMIFGYLHLNKIWLKDNYSNEQLIEKRDILKQIDICT